MIAYTDFLEKIEEILNNNLPGVSVLVSPPMLGESTLPEVDVSLSKVKMDERTLNTPDPYSSIVSVDIFCVEYSPDGVKASSRKRDALMGNVCDILKQNRTLDGLCDITQLGDIEFEDVKNAAGFFSGAMLEFRIYVTS